MYEDKTDILAVFTINKHSMPALCLMLESFNQRCETPCWVEVLIETRWNPKLNRSEVLLVHLYWRKPNDWFNSLNEILKASKRPAVYSNNEKVEISSLNSDHIRLICLDELDDNHDEAQISVHHIHPNKGKWDSKTMLHLMISLSACHDDVKMCLQDTMRNLVTLLIEGGMSDDEIEGLFDD